LPQYDDIWKAGPCQLKAPDGSVVDADIAQDTQLRMTKYQVTGGDGETRIIDFGGIVPPQGTVKLLASHDECCFKAGEVEGRGWKEKGKQSCVDKTDGPSLHVAAFSVEWGNGCVCTCPEGPAPYPISLSELEAWHEAWVDWKNGTGGKPDPPRTADVRMYPGESTNFS